MIVIPPIIISESNLTSSTVAEPSSGEVLWSAATNYTVGTVVIRAQTHRKYEALIAGTDAGTPETTPTRWLDIGPTNKWAMFDQRTNIQTEATSGSMTVVITPGRRIDSLALIGVQAKVITVTLTVGGVVQYGPKVISANARTTVNWSQYFFGDFEYLSIISLQDIPPYSGAVITIKFDNDAGSVKCSGVILGLKTFIGNVQYNAKSDSLNFSKIERDEFGNSELIPRRTVPRTQQTLWCDKNNVNVVRRVRTELNAVPAFWSGLDDDITNPYFEAIAIFGIYKQFEIDLAHPSIALINLELEEL